MLKPSIEIGLILSSLLFYVDFDRSFDAVFSVGISRPIIEVDEYSPYITTAESGKFGEAASFTYEDKLESIWTKDVVRYPAKGNFPYTQDRAFDGTIGMWIQIDIEELKKRSLIWLDPVHLLAENDRDNGKIWMDFVTSELPNTPIFRFGATDHRNNSEGQNLEGDHVIVIPNIDFKGDEWHHIVGTWKGLNSSDGSDAVLHLYIDGIRVGEIEGFNHLLDWDIDEWEIRIGLGFKGKIDDFFILDRFVGQEEINMIYQPDKSLGELLGI